MVHLFSLSIHLRMIGGRQVYNNPCEFVEVLHELCCKLRVLLHSLAPAPMLHLICPCLHSPSLIYTVCTCIHTCLYTPAYMLVHMCLYSHSFMPICMCLHLCSFVSACTHTHLYAPVFALVCVCLDSPAPMPRVVHK